MRSSSASGKKARAKTAERTELQRWLNFISTELHKQFYWLFHSGPAEIQQAQRARIATRLAELNEHLAARPYLAGKRFTVADAYAFAVINWCGTVDIDVSRYPNLDAYMARVAARPKVREALHAEGLLKG